jgi:hypothetical protein
MAKRLGWALVVLLALAAGGCSNGGDECDKCSSDDDCRSGFVCSTFDDGSQRCGSGVGFTQCRTLGGRRTRPVLATAPAPAPAPAPSPTPAR